jgi:hypothetical protein
MAEIGTERVEATVPVPERLRDEPGREPRSRPRRRQAAETNNSDDAENPEVPQHQIDSLA